MTIASKGKSKLITPFMAHNTSEDKKYDYYSTNTFYRLLQYMP